MSPGAQLLTLSRTEELFLRDCGYRASVDLCQDSAHTQEKTKTRCLGSCNRFAGAATLLVGRSCSDRERSAQRIGGSLDEVEALPRRSEPRRRFLDRS